MVDNQCEYVFESLSVSLSTDAEMPPPPTTIWLNKHGIAVLELPFPHAFRPRADGWEVEFSAGGRLTARLLHGGEYAYDVRVGDKLVASRDEMYLAVKT
jgi:hypothetical protein